MDKFWDNRLIMIRLCMLSSYGIVYLPIVPRYSAIRGQSFQVYTTCLHHPEHKLLLLRMYELLASN